jgi:hemerythrin-like domain-containing protein
MALPMSLAAMNGDHDRVLSVLDALSRTSEPTARADLAAELVRCCARYQDAEERAVYPVLHAIADDQSEVALGEDEQRTIRDTMSEISRRTRHVKALNAHADDPEGFEASLDKLVDSIQVHLDHEERSLFPLIDHLDGADLERLRADVERAVAHASTHPRPPHNPIGRVLSNVEEMIERVVQDASTPWHPGLKYLKDHEAED